MQADQILAQLNEQQREAVTSSGCNVMVVAGAGSGKTRVLVHRIAWLIAVDQVPPQNVFAVTFTNKAAKEMSSRVSEMLGYESKGMWIGTFHGIAHRFLRLHWSDAGLDQNFQILDADDQLRQIKKIIKESSFDESRYPPKEITWFINSQKDLGLRPDKSKGKRGYEHYLEIYAAYEKLCRQNNLVDFGELLLRFFETLKNNKTLLEHYQNRFENILVDEFQDTNEIQYQIIKLLTGSSGNAFIVGDDDQSIYRWRGANPDSMPRFRNDFLDPRSIKLEQNYRSTKNILNAANSIISNNNGRLEKNLWTDEGSGPLIKLHQNFDEYEEASNIIETIESKSGKLRLSDIAVLYRSNAQSRVIEEALIRKSIPYRVYGGFRFFDRAEVKDALAYLRLTQNVADDIAFERACSVPPKGIGAQTMDKVKNYARDEGLCLFLAADQLIQSKVLNNRATNSLSAFLGSLNETKKLITEQPLEKQFEIVIEQSKLIPHLKEKKTEQSATKIDNIMELINAAHGFRQPFDDDDLSPMQSFLAHAALESGENQASEWQ
ncbi:MAG TPA: DNA helicase II, partial [Gammaproteobacteria bacterium]|nr:DNA helicase II [Gammaproteobacteria bacterium]